tara:strand:+ start:29505 stop:30461 length:957 start_codon:yes stop_codon:yes gene_type:complete
MNLGKTFLYGLAVSGLILTACKKEEDNQPTTDPQTNNPSAQDLGAYFDQNIQDEVESFTADASSSFMITTSGGSQLSFPANAFEDANGNTVSGSINLEVVELLDKHSMLLANKPTMGNLPGGGRAPLTSGGEFRVTATQNGNEIDLRDGFGYSATVPAPNGIDPNMDVFYGSSNGDTLTWDQADSAAVWGQNGFYETYFDSLNWVNLDYFTDSSGMNTTINVEVPAGFDNTNCMLFISFDGLNSLANLYNYQNGAFTSAPYYTLEIGTEVHFVAVSSINGDLHTAIVSATIDNNHYEVISSLDLTSESQFESDINALP